MITHIHILLFIILTPLYLSGKATLLDNSVFIELSEDSLELKSMKDTLLLDFHEIDSIKLEIIRSRLPFYLIPSRFNQPYVPYKKSQVSLILNVNRNIRFDMAVFDRFMLGAGIDNLLRSYSDYTVGRVFGHYAFSVSDRIAYALGSEYEFANDAKGIVKIHNSLNFVSEILNGSAYLTYMIRDAELLPYSEIGASFALKLGRKTHFKTDVKYIPDYDINEAGIPWRTSPWDFEIGFRFHYPGTSMGLSIVNTGTTRSSLVLTFALPISGWRKMPKYSLSSDSGYDRSNRQYESRKRPFLLDLLFY